MLDTTKIAGYDEMSAEEKVKALEAYEVEDYSKLKNALNKTSSEVADYKRQLKEKMDAEERAKFEQAEKEAEYKRLFEEQQAELDKMKKETQVATAKAKFASLGFNDELAGKSAEQLVNGKSDELFASIATFKEDYKTQLEKERISSQPKIKEGDTSKAEPEDAFMRGMERALGL